jgi:hypothetical protein
MSNRLKWLIGGNLTYIIVFGGLGLLLGGKTVTPREYYIVYSIFGGAIVLALLIWTLYCVFRIKD